MTSPRGFPEVRTEATQATKRDPQIRASLAVSIVARGWNCWWHQCLWRLGTALWVCLGFVPNTRAVIFWSTGDQAHNTTAPAGQLSNSGWQWVVYWSGGQGAAIGPHHFITAHHIGGEVGGIVRFQGREYVTTAIFDDPESDLRVGTVADAFPSWAPLYRGAHEVGQPIIFFGTGLSRGVEVRVADRLRGWRWGAGRGTLRWGENVIVRTVTLPRPWGPLVYAAFDPGLGPESADLAGGDSGAPVFLHDRDGWKLAGIAAIVDGHVNDSNEGPGFDAALVDSRGLFVGSADGWRRIDAPLPVRSGFYASRVSARLAWIDGVLSAPLAAPPAPADDAGDLPKITTPQGWPAPGG